MQTGFQQSAFTEIIGVEAAGFCVFFKDKYFLAETSKSDTGCQT
jgi:hypothetical protein